MSGKIRIKPSESFSFSLNIDGWVVTVRESADLYMEPGLSDGSPVNIHMVYDADLHRVVADRVEILRAGDGSEITSKYLREVKVQNAVRHVAMNEMIEVYFSGSIHYGVPSATKFLDTSKPAKGRERHDVLVDAAIVYEIALLGALPPLQKVADYLQVSQSTATRYVSEARRNGLIKE